MRLLELIVVGRVGDGREMKNSVELFVPELFAPIESGQVGRHKIAKITGQVFEVAGTEIVDHGDARVRVFFLEPEGQVGADKTGAAGNDKIKRRFGGAHG